MRVIASPAPTARQHSDEAGGLEIVLVVDCSPDDSLAVCKKLAAEPGAPVTVDSRLREMSFGVWEGHTLAELRQTVGEKFLDAERRGLDFHPPGGESPRLVMERIGNWAAETARTGAPVVAVSHKAAIRALLALATGWDMTGRQPVKLDWRCVHFFATDVDGTVRLERPNVPLVTA